MSTPFIMKFTKLHIQNFQSHRDTTISFTDGLNIIVGPTDSGKSAIVRALRKLVRDEPMGKAFISKWSKDMDLSLTFEIDGDEYVVRRKVTPSKNIYCLDTEEFGGFGKTIPQEIQNALDMKLIELETGDILDLSFTDQHDSPFMVAKGQAGNRSKILGRIAGLSVLDSAIARINSDIRASNSEIKHKDEARDILQSVIDDWPGLWRETTIIDDLAPRIEAVKRLTVKHSDISKIALKFTDKDEECAAYEARFSKLPEISEDYRNLIPRVITYNHVRKVARKLHTCETEIQRFNSLKIPEIIVDFEGIKKRQLRLNKLQTMLNKVQGVVKTAADIDEVGITSRLEKHITEHTAILAELGICPTCEQPIGECQ